MAFWAVAGQIIGGLMSSQSGKGEPWAEGKAKLEQAFNNQQGLMTSLVAQDQNSQNITQNQMSNAVGGNASLNTSDPRSIGNFFQSLKTTAKDPNANFFSGLFKGLGGG